MTSFNQRLSNTSPLRDASLRKFIIKIYQRTVEQSDCDVELKRSLACHERVPQFLRNLEHEISRLPHTHQSRDKIGFVVSELTRTFLKNIRQKAEEMMLSDAEKSRLKTREENVKILDRAATTGIIDEEVIHVLRESE